MNFQKIILVLAILLLIGALIFIGISLKQSKKNATWPPLIPDCPDYWVAFDPNTMDGTPYGLANSSTYLATIGQNTCTNGVSTSTTSTTPTKIHNYGFYTRSIPRKQWKLQKIPMGHLL